MKNDVRPICCGSPSSVTVSFETPAVRSGSDAPGEATADGAQWEGTSGRQVAASALVPRPANRNTAREGLVAGSGFLAIVAGLGYAARAQRAGNDIWPGLVLAAGGASCVVARRPMAAHLVPRWPALSPSPSGRSQDAGRFALLSSPSRWGVTAPFVALGRRVSQGFRQESALDDGRAAVWQGLRAQLSVPRAHHDCPGEQTTEATLKIMSDHQAIGAMWAAEAAGESASAAAYLQCISTAHLCFLVEHLKDLLEIPKLGPKTTVELRWFLAVFLGAEEAHLALTGLDRLARQRIRFLHPDKFRVEARGDETHQRGQAKKMLEAVALMRTLVAAKHIRRALQVSDPAPAVSTGSNDSF